MFKARHFPTGSRFNGFYNDSLHSMDGFGNYFFPDGSTYRGYFHKGIFHGYGSLQLAAPYNFTLSGIYKHGVLTQVDEMVFSDGLVIRVPFTGNNLDTSEWLFCTPSDRRFAAEIMDDVCAVGPELLNSKEHTLRNLPVGTYDTVEGIFRPQTGFLTSVPRPFAPRRYIACRDEEKWIREKCRYNCHRHEPLPLRSEVCKLIIDTNSNDMAMLGEGTRRCACRYTKDTQRRCKHFNKLHAGGEPSSDDMPAGDSESLEERIRLVNCTDFWRTAAREEPNLRSDIEVTLPFSASLPSPDTLSCIDSLLNEDVANCYIELETLKVPKEFCTDGFTRECYSKEKCNLTCQLRSGSEM